MILPLSLPEAMGTFIGLEIAAGLRDILALAPAVVILSGAVQVLVRVMRNQAKAWDLLIYVIATGFILTVFWPQTATIAPGSVQAQAAAGAPLKSVGDLLPGRSSAKISKIQLKYLEIVSSSWVNLALLINPEGKRPFSEANPLSWMMSQNLQADSVRAIRVWATACVAPARRQLLDSGAAVTWEDLAPFPGSALYTVMTTIQVRFAGESYSDFSPTLTRQSCTNFASSIFSGVQAELSGLTTPNGTGLVTIWNSELGVQSAEIAKMMIHREVVRALGPEIPAPSIMGTYAGIRVGRSVAGGIGKIVSGLANLNGAMILSGGLSVVTGGASDAIADLTESMQALAGKALFVTKFAPDIMGGIMIAVNAVFPLVVLWSLAPGQHVKPLAGYAILVAAIYSMPVAWAAVDLFGELALNSAGQAFGYGNPFAFLNAAAHYFVIITVVTWAILVAMIFAVLIPTTSSIVAVVGAFRS